MVQIVVDTNTSISALLWGGVPQHLVTLAINNSIPLLTSEALLQELETTLNKPKLAKYVLLSGRKPSELVAELARIMVLVEPANIPADVVRDPDDIKVLAAAVGGKATHIISGDNDLLVLKAYENISILKALDFINEIKPNIDP
ncbi:MAG: putative toxin-antitoxin system toxin component, PIN family [Anaerolineae bacterium]|nr:putative toxin-antitoxin system toxin component, PIN family [Anaerolineae bacterium]